MYIAILAESLKWPTGHPVVKLGPVDHLFEPQQSAEIGRLPDQAAILVLRGAFIRQGWTNV
jgi:hypothetical protein